MVKRSVFLALGFVGVLPTLGQLSKLPACALTCATNSIASTGCALTNIACICSSQSYLQSLAPCVAASCTPAEQEQAFAAAKQICAQAGVTLSIPVAATTSAPPAPASSSAPVSSAAVGTSAIVQSVSSSYVPAPATAAAVPTAVIGFANAAALAGAAVAFAL